MGDILGAAIPIIKPRIIQITKMIKTKTTQNASAKEAFPLKLRANKFDINGSSSLQYPFTIAEVTSYLPIQKLEKICPNKSSAPNSPVISFKESCAKRNSSAANSGAFCVFSAKILCCT